MVSTDELVTALQVAVRDNPGGAGVTMSYRGRSVSVSPEQRMASVEGRLVALPAPAVRSGRRWLVPLDVVPRALALIYDRKIELRQPARLLIVGDLRVPRVTVRLDAAGPPTRLTIEASPTTLITPVIESGRVVLRLDADALDVAPLPQAGGLLEQARTEGNSVVLMLSPRAGQARATRGAGDNLSRITLEVPFSVQSDAAATPGPVSVPPPAPVPADVAVPATGVASSGVIVIDPGHGGNDAGARGPNGLEEKALTLDIARRLKNMIETRLAMRVILTREDDRAVSEDERTALANSSKADLFVSLHLNAALAPSASGAEIYQLRGERESGSRAAAAPSEPVTLPVTAGGLRTVTLVPWDVAQHRHRDSSTLLANLIESSLRPYIPLSTQPVREARLRILAGLDMAAVVVEIAYLTNPQQAAALVSDEYQSKAAQGLFDAVTAYRNAVRGAAR
jgi:N-acetylmuramoyl-L-alanine amidase